MRNEAGQFTEVDRDLNWVQNMSVPEEETNCWNWTGYIGLHGYGTYRMPDKNWLAHRLVFESINGYVPRVVMHSCDNRKCVNPDHLQDGTQKKNLQDMVDRGRIGPTAFKQRVSDGIRAKIKAEATTRVATQKQIAEKYGVDQSLVSRIKSGTDTNRTRYGGG